MSHGSSAFGRMRLNWTWLQTRADARVAGGRRRRLDGALINLVADEGVPFVAGRPDAVNWLIAPTRIIPRSQLD